MVYTRYRIRKPGYRWAMRNSSREMPEPTADELAFRFASGRLCLEFVMTVGDRRTRAYERLRGEADLARWVVAAGLVDEEPRVTARQLDGARVLREAIHDLARAAVADKPLSPADIETVNAWAARPDLAPQLFGSGEVEHSPGRETVEACLSSVARDAAHLLGDDDRHRLRECDGDGCGVLFFDSSRAGNRRWCSDSVCGNRARVTAHRRRGR
jgi:predicted RNA-binding Zn ribbon-like protein